MTTLVHTRQPLQVLSMSNSSKRGRSQRTSSYDEQDGDFQFTRAKPKKARTAQSAPIPEEPEFVPVVAVKKTTRPRQSAKTTAREGLPPSPPRQPAPQRTSKRKSDQITRDVAPAEERQQSPPSPPPVATQTKKSRRKPPRTLPAEDDEEDSRPKTTRQLTRRGPKPEARQEEVLDEEHDDVEQVHAVDRDATPEATTKAKGKKIALPFADTPVINRNKEMRKQTGGGRRSSLGMRGRRASSLIENGNNAIPHRAVEPAQFYKHISSDGLTEPRRMKQLLTWCAERALAEKPPLGSANANAVHGARAIQDQLLKDFASKSEFSDWFAREEVEKPPPIVKPNPRNLEHDAKIAELEARLQRLRAEKKTWQAIKAAPIDQSPLFPSASSTTAGEVATSNRSQAVTLPLPEASLLDADESRMLEALVAPTSSSQPMSTSQVRSRLQILQQSLEFKIDHLADSVHKVEQRVITAGRQADKVLGLSAARLKERAERERGSAGTREMPVMEVLRSLGRILPEGGG
ncbi:Mis12-Mtw1 protein family-domain-containing protein [Microdochium trichocladiopsis]|uniref:Mis12-Mtw1 protein family-domain-containing protein n=1 Tax=Microdochium trichocladiopsis TaxID=1682393 RepID=A0A9P9BM99_9PEZI|nr:Mis12-Mtw1 protein family-domain-containing protein [Microdochium trichocladiopsis]KAH7026068.1 Mis12-Mtw1 protein family-domain-containing protein [Microdochium trichocladiopsis]